MCVDAHEGRRVARVLGVAAVVLGVAAVVLGVAAVYQVLHHVIMSSVKKILRCA